MEFNYNIEGGNFSRAGTASSEVKKILKQLNVNPAVLKRIASVYRSHRHHRRHQRPGARNTGHRPSHAGRIFHRLPRSPGNGIRSWNGSPEYAEKLRQTNHRIQSKRGNKSHDDYFFLTARSSKKSYRLQVEPSALQVKS